MKLITIFFFIIPNLLWSDILNNFSLACICNKNINALKYFDCKQKVSGTQLDLKSDNFVYSTFDKKNYEKDVAFGCNLLKKEESYHNSPNDPMRKEEIFGHITHLQFQPLL